jgi:hypothetical protein
LFACRAPLAQESRPSASTRPKALSPNRNTNSTKGMPAHPPKTTVELVKLARIYSSGVVPDEFRQSLPIPVRTPAGTGFRFFFCPAQARPKEPTQLAPPAHALLLQAEHGQFVELRAVNSADFGQKHPAHQPIGSVAMPAGWNYETYLEHQTRFYKLVDYLLPYFTAQTNSLSQEGRHFAREYLDLFQKLSEPPLLPYYESAGETFFAWIRRVAA